MLSEAIASPDKDANRKQIYPCCESNPVLSAHIASKHVFFALSLSSGNITKSVLGSNMASSNLSVVVLYI
jgi:hypothetical protein